VYKVPVEPLDFKEIRDLKGSLLSVHRVLKALQDLKVHKALKDFRLSGLGVLKVSLDYKAVKGHKEELVFKDLKVSLGLKGL